MRSVANRALTSADRAAVAQKLKAVKEVRRKGIPDLPRVILNHTKR